MVLAKEIEQNVPSREHSLAQTSIIQM